MAARFAAKRRVSIDVGEWNLPKGRILTQNSAAASKYFSMPELGADMTERRSFKSASNKARISASRFPVPPASRSGVLVEEKALSPSCNSTKPTTTVNSKKIKSVSFAVTSSNEKVECVAKAKSAGSKLCGKNSSKTTRKQSKSKDKSSLTVINKARSVLATSDRVVTTPLKSTHSEGSQQMSKSITGPRLMPKRSRSSPIKLEALKPHDEMKSVSALSSITSKEDMLMQCTSSSHAIDNKNRSVEPFRSIGEKDSQCSPNKTFSYPHRPVTVPKVCRLPEITDVNKKTMKAHLQPQPSYTNRLLSSLPPVGTTTPLSATTQLNDVKEFGDWVSTWGGGLKGWAMAQTLQKLKDAQRKGEKEVKWQRTIDELEEDPFFAPQIQRIKVLRMEIAKVRSQREETEKQLKEKKFSSSKIQKSVKKVQEEVKATVKECEEILHKINAHPLAAMVSGAKKLLFGN